MKHTFMLTKVKVSILYIEGILHIRMLHLMCILVYPATFWTSIAFNLSLDILSCVPHHTYYSPFTTIYITLCTYNKNKTKITKKRHQYFTLAATIFTTLNYKNLLLS
jgi:hypothetical protein